MATLGSDISGIVDCDKYMSLASPGRSAAQAVARAQTHENGVLWWAPDRGHPLTQYMHSEENIPRLKQKVRQEAERDERVTAAQVDAVLYGEELTVTIKLELTNNEADVTLTLTIDQLGSVINTQVF